MSRRLQMMFLSVIVGVPVMFAALLGTSANRAPAFAAEQAVASPASVVLPAALPLPRWAALVWTRKTVSTFWSLRHSLTMGGFVAVPDQLSGSLTLEGPRLSRS